MPWSHRVLPLTAFASRRNRPRPVKAAQIAAYRLPEGPHYASDEICSPTGKPSKSCLLPPSDKPATRPGSSAAAEQLDRSQKVLLQGLPTTLSTGSPLGEHASSKPSQATLGRTPTGCFAQFSAPGATKVQLNCCASWRIWLIWSSKS